MSQDLVLALALPVTLFLMMFAMGTTLRPGDFKALVEQPARVAVGLASQLLLLPLLAMLVLAAIPMSEAVFAGFVILALSPGGSTSNLFSYLAGGSVALSIALTALVSLIAPFSLPLAANWLLGETLDNASLALPVLPTVLRLVAITILPLLLGMLLRGRREDLCKRWESLLTRLPFVMLLAVIGGIVAQNREQMPAFLAQTWLPALALATAALIVAYAFARLCRRDARDARTIAIETSIQNGGTAMLVTGTILNNPAMTVAPIMYGILMLIPMFVFLLLRAWLRPRELPVAA
ncbi:MAG: bile acid:sodium symporter [Halieaceae bacterium]|nr:bile acid:sodium symporter [Halieaceae bacterium]